MLEGRLGRDVSTAPEALGGYQVRHYLSSTIHHGITGEEHIFPLNEDLYRFAEAPKLPLGSHPRQLRVELDVPVDGPELPCG